MSDEGQVQVTSEPETGQETGSFGAWLRCQREGREIALREIADASKISLRYLQAFEEERFEILPSPVFAKGFLRQYAKYVGLDPEEVVNYYSTARQETDVEELQSPTSLRQPIPDSSGFPMLPVVIVLAAAVLLGALYGLGVFNDLGRFQWFGKKENPPEVVSEPQTAMVQPPPPRTAVPIEPPPPAVTAPKPVTEEPAAPLAPLRLAIEFSDECWVEVRRDGRHFLSELKYQGEALQIEAEREIRLTLGDVSAAQVELNGRPVPYRNGNPEGSRWSLMIRPETVDELTEP